MINLYFIYGKTYLQDEIKAGEGGCITQEFDGECGVIQRSCSGKCLLRCDTVWYGTEAPMCNMDLLLKFRVSHAG